MAEFTMKPIQEDEIRLVSIAPALDPDEPLHCLLTHYRRGDDTKYAAVSYTWGDSTITAVVNCNGSDMEVPASCAAALRTLRHHSRVETLWIDAICINQKDMRERSQQVAHIGEVFRQASHTYAYLGESSHFYDEDSDDEAWIELLKRPWFRRTWVIQEVLLSRHILMALGIQRLSLIEALQHCEARKLRLPTLLRLRNEFVHDYARRPPKSWEEMNSLDPENMDGDDVLAMLDRRPRSRQTKNSSNPISRSQPTNFSHGDTKRRPDDIHDASQEVVYKGSGHTDLSYWRLPTLLNETKEFKARDPRDKLYALLPLFQQPIPELLYPSYLKTTAEVYTDLSRYMLEEGLPQSLSYAGNHANSDLPSWVTDWQQPAPASALKSSIQEMTTWRAGYQPGRREVKPLFGNTSQATLMLRGMVLGETSGLSKKRVYTFTLETWPEFEVTLEISINQTSVVDEERIMISWSWDGTLPGIHSDRSDLELFNQGIRVVAHIKTILPVKSHQWSPFKEVFAHKISADAYCPGAANVVHLATEWIDRYGLNVAASLERLIPVSNMISIQDIIEFKAGSGKEPSRVTYTGIAALPPSVGDQLCILIGFTSPFLMRQHESGWRLIGECRITNANQVMTGTVIDGIDWSHVWDEQPLYPLEDFIIF